MFRVLGAHVRRGDRALEVRNEQSTRRQNGSLFDYLLALFRLLQRASVAGRTPDVGSNNASQSAREIWRLQENGPRDSWYRAQVTLASPAPFQVMECLNSQSEDTSIAGCSSVSFPVRLSFSFPKRASDPIGGDRRGIRLRRHSRRLISPGEWTLSR